MLKQIFLQTEVTGPITDESGMEEKMRFGERQSKAEQRKDMRKTRPNALHVHYN
jgi:hypothetical protein